MKRAFAPEFLNRIDDVIVFNSLDKDDIFQIIDIELKSLFARIEALGYHIELTTEAKDFIADKGFDHNFGARPLKRAIQKFLEDPVAEEILKGEIAEGEALRIDYDKTKEEIVVSHQKQDATPEKPADADIAKEQKDE